MQGYNQYYQSPASLQAGPSGSNQKFVQIDEQQQSRAGYEYALQPAPLHPYNTAAPLYPSMLPDIPHYPIPTSSHSNSSSSISFPTQSLSPTSLRSSISSSLNTPVTPLDLNSPHGIKDAQMQGSWFGAMQESYLANKRLTEQQRPPLQRMGRMSVGSPQTGYQHGPNHRQIHHSGSHFLSVDGQPRRASVATFQPTAARPSSVPRRPSIQPTGHSEPVMYTQSGEMRMSSPGSHTHQPPQLSLDVPKIVSPQPLTAAETNMEVERLYAEVFGSQNTSLSNQATPLASLYTAQPTSGTSPTIYSPSAGITPTMSPRERDNYNFSGVLLQPEDLHMLGDGALSPTATEMPGYTQQTTSSPNAGWQTSFSLTVPSAPTRQGLQPALPINTQPDNWNFASFHGFQPIAESSHTSSMVERALSAPPRDETVPTFLAPDRRRGSSVDSAAMLPFSQLPSVLEPVNVALLSPTRTSSSAYLGSGPVPYQQSTVAARRSTVGPGSLILQQVPRASLPATPPNRFYDRSRAIPPASAPPTANRPALSPTPSPRRYTGRGTARRGSGNAAPMFINFTSKDANKLLSGVAPSGSSKRKRDEEEARNAGSKQTRSEGMTSPRGSPLPPSSPQVSQ